MPRQDKTAEDISIVFTKISLSISFIASIVPIAIIFGVSAQLVESLSSFLFRRNAIGY